MSKRGWLLMILGLLGVLFVLPLQVQADGAAVQLTPRPTLVPLPTEPPVPTATPIFVAPTSIEGAYIELHITQEAWSVVQWQDGQGAWHHVEGWQGLADEQGAVRWWVGPAQFGLGPFRWVIYDKPGGTLLAVSQSFDLPQVARQRVVVEVTLQP
jgi:hypothetical protein